MLPWRNRLARTTVNRKVGGSSPPGSELIQFFFFTLMNSSSSESSEEFIAPANTVFVQSSDEEIIEDLEEDIDAVTLFSLPV